MDGEIACAQRLEVMRSCCGLTREPSVAGLGGTKLKLCEAETLGPHVSHVVVGPETPIKRTLKLLFAMARGVPVVRADWILRTHSSGLELTPPPAAHHQRGARTHTAACCPSSSATTPLLL